MKPELRVVVNIPLSGLFDSSGDVQAKRVRPLAADDIQELLRASPQRFVFAEAGQPLDWVPVNRCFDTWKREVRPHLADPGSNRITLDEFPGNYFYFADEWRLASGETVIVLERHH